MASAVVGEPTRRAEAGAAEGRGPVPFGLPWPVWALAVAVCILELVFGPRYGLFRDEYYYLVCADHLDWGYVDHPPFSIGVLALVRAALGDGVVAVRLVPALLGAVLVVLAAQMARVMGGGRGARVLAAASVAAAPQYLAIAGFYSMNAFDLVFWSAAALVVARLTPDERRLRPFLLLGLLLGLGLLDKYSVLFFAAGLAVALVATPLRRLLRRPGPWLAAGTAGLLFLPHVAWQIRHGFPTLEFIENATRHKNVATAPLQFLAAQVLEMNPLDAPLWVGGLVWLLFTRRGRPLRALGIIYVVALLVVLTQHGKPYYLGPAYPPLLAAGAVFFWGLPWGRVRLAVLALVLASGLILAPLVVPVLPVERLIAYQAALGLAPVAEERHALGPLPQLFADRFGWAELAATVADAYRSLPAAEQARAAIVASNYGEAGALRYHGRSYGLPPAMSPHNSFYYWGPSDAAPIDVAILIGVAPDDARRLWTSVQEAGRWSSPYAMPYERRWPILVCRGLKRPAGEAWRAGRHFI